MHIIAKFTINIFIASMVLLSPLSAWAIDEDGCYRPSNYCISVESSSWKGNRFTVKYRNNCNSRIYMRFCNERTGGRSADCGASGITPQGTKSWWTTKQNATGRYSYTFTGSTKGSSDWVCSGKVSGWKDDQF